MSINIRTDLSIKHNKIHFEIESFSPLSINSWGFVSRFSSTKPIQTKTIMISITIVSLLSFISALPQSQSTSNLTPLCVDPSAVSCAIDSSKYLGTWYEQGRSQIIRSTFEKDSRCVTANYQLKADQRNVQVTNKAITGSPAKLDVIVGNAQLLDTPGQLKVSFGDQSTGGQIGNYFQNLVPGPNYVVKNVWTDANGEYKRALVTYAKALGPLQFIWILSRDPVISDADLKETLDYARKAGFNPDAAKFERTPCNESERLLNP